MLMSELLDQHRVALLADFKSSLAVLITKLDTLQSVFSDQCQRITELEKHAEVVCKCLEQLESVHSSILEQNKLLKAKLSDLEGHIDARIFASSDCQIQWKVHVPPYSSLSFLLRFLLKKDSHLPQN